MLHNSEISLAAVHNWLGNHSLQIDKHKDNQGADLRQDAMYNHDEQSVLRRCSKTGESILHTTNVPHKVNGTSYLHTHSYVWKSMEQHKVHLQIQVQLGWSVPLTHDQAYLSYMFEGLKVDMTDCQKYTTSWAAVERTPWESPKTLWNQHLKAWTLKERSFMRWIEEASSCFFKWLFADCSCVEIMVGLDSRSPSSITVWFISAICLQRDRHAHHHN